jgi:glutamyl-tRNA reductase
MSLKILGLNHNTAPVEIREQVVFAGEQIPGALQAVRDIEGVDEAVLLSTCNRTEFYVMADATAGLAARCAQPGPVVREYTVRAG